ncbi:MULTISPECIES: response regulator [Herpetosiphon]|uniref:Fis family transcriptional regulator n=3 Tax=Herpetosiphon TaxID=64 RepID=A0A0P6YA77_9CHLR|nr:MULTISPECIES: response regulator [Herpetosiphon]ABX03235.1 response regulator receiver protein [Herpetosiphon aurantiacus DSM 785]MCA0354634.1 response regulator [Chloroflexota bacterium]KPL86196.1 Fis family transcriptional regulator [Herpetosiphon geysericola]MBM7845806.1 CheY-like chemotaxis protein [Herpetosiphon giganteus]HBW52530.1 response regulator [Herpetosiphon sp.]
MAKTIFIMDDDLALQMVMEIALREVGYEVVLANNGVEGIAQLETLKPDLIISDIMMPEMDGVEAFNQIRERIQDEGIPMVIVTALNRKPWFSDLEEEGAVILQKPFEVDTFIDLINTMVSD